MTTCKSWEMFQYINCRIRVTTNGGQQLIGNFLAFDPGFDLVLGDCEEVRKLPPTKGSEEEREVRRTIGLVRLRRLEVLLIAEAPPPPDDNRLRTSAIPGPGRGRVTRHQSLAQARLAQARLAASVCGIDGPSPGRAAGQCVVPSQLAQAQPRLAGPVRRVGGRSPGMMPPPMMWGPPPPGGPPEPGMLMPGSPPGQHLPMPEPKQGLPPLPPPPGQCQVFPLPVPPLHHREMRAL